MQKYHRLAFYTLIMIFVVIGAGSIVRTTGSGLGCPDWPTCFNRIIPPTSIQQLPSNYQEMYPHYKDTAFNVWQTWIEYLNRLVGLIGGIFVLIFTLYSIKFIRSKPVLFYCALLSLILVLVNAGFGALVIKTHLNPGVVTIHMILALAVVSVLTIALNLSQEYSSLQSYKEEHMTERWYLSSKLWGIILALFIIQILLGTQVRETVDITSKITTERNLWVEHFPTFFYIHRSSSGLFIITVLFGLYMAHKHKIAYQIQKQFRLILLFLMIVIIAGISLNHLGFPKIAQPIHLLGACASFSSMLYLYILLLRKF